jgi:hypothetical protein
VTAPGKTYLFEKDDGTTSGKGHEMASSLIVPSLLAGSGLNEIEISSIGYLVKWHDQYSLSYCEANLTGRHSGDEKNDVVKIMADQPECAIELLFHIIADEYGAEVSQWKTDYLLKILAENAL